MTSGVRPAAADRAGARAAGRSPRPAGTTQDGVRRHNLGTLLAEVHRVGAVSRADLTATMGLNRSTIGGLVAELAALGLVAEGPAAGAADRALRPADRRGGPGRPSHVVRPRPARASVVAVDLGVGHLVVARVGLGGAVLARRELSHPAREAGLDEVVDVVAAACSDLLAGVGPGEAWLGVGVGAPGTVRHDDGLVRFAPNLGWVDQPLGTRLAARLGVPVVVGNDADLAVVAERLRGAAAGCDDVVYLSGQVGVGGGLVVDGRPLRGRGGYAGEVGHLPLVPGGRPCRCGARGCWETEIGEDALLVAAGWPAGGGVAAVREVLAAARAGDARAAAALDAVARWLGVGVGALVNLLNPEVVLFGGALREVVEVAEGCVRAGMASASLDVARRQVRLAVPALAPDSVLLGAAEAALAPLFADPAGTLSAAGARRR